MADVRYEQLTCTYSGSAVPAVDALDLHVADGELMVLVGPSGSGKSTALRTLAGLEEVTDGRVLIGGTDVTHAQPRHRDVAMVFQNYALYPHMTVAENIAFPLRVQRMANEEKLRRVREAARLLDLERYLDRKPKQLSGGQRQRVAMGRAIVREPHVFLMDEPLSNLDAQLRVQTRSQIAQLQARLGTTTIYVTHDQVEAMTLGDRVAVLKDGVLQQCDTPRELYERPANVFVARFIGSPAMNVQDLPVDGNVLRFGDLPVPIPAAVRAATAGATHVTVGVRPECLLLTGDEGVPAHVDVVEELGADAYVFGTVRLGDGEQQVIVRTDGRTPPRKGETVRLGLDVGGVHFFHPVTGSRIAA